MTRFISSYQASLDYLYSFVDYSLTRHLQYSPEKFDLDRMRRFMSLLGDPHLKYPTIHVAGTKGKGSICAMIASIITVSGLKVGLYTSPHLQEYTERIKVNDKEISRKEFVSIVESLKPAIPKIKNLSTFEITTALAFKYFLNESVDLAVIEVGLGGRLDATNVVNPIISVISSISRDHVKILGNSLEEIAVEKAGIIKDNVAVVISKQKPRIKKLIENIAKQKKSVFLSAEVSFRFQIAQQSPYGQDIIVTEKDGHMINLHIPLIGQHQIQNALTALLAVRSISKEGYQITDQDIQKGFSGVKWPGRCEILADIPLLMVDSAHNTDSIRQLVKTIKSVFPNRKIIVIFGASEDKDIIGMLNILLPVSNQIITSQSVHPRAMNADTILDIVQKSGYSGLSFHSINRALAEAVEIWDHSSIIVVTGSIFFAAAVREIWQNKNRKKIL